MNIHITTPASLRAGMEDIEPCICGVCGQKTMYVDWCGMMCSTCGSDIESTRQSSIRNIRARADLSIQDISKLTNFPSEEIKNLEKGNAKPVPDDYWKAFCQAITKHYIDNPKVKRNPDLCVLCDEKATINSLCKKCHDDAFSKINKSRRLNHE